MTDRLITSDTYCTAFETWASVRTLDDAQRALLNAALAHVRETFPDATTRPPDAYCVTFAEFLGERDEGDEGAAARHLDLAIRKSCLLDRLVYRGEALRVRKCPLHNGKWSGLGANECPHGCTIGCGCTTGWLPDVETAIKDAIAHREAFVASQRNNVTLRYEARSLNDEVARLRAMLAKEDEP